MPFFDYPLQELEKYRPDIAEPADFEDFWCRTLAEHPGLPEPIELLPVARHLRGVRVFDVTLQGFGGQPVKAWYLLPRDADEDLPLVISFVGYGGGRGLPEEHLTWTSCGYANLVVDTRAQGAHWSGGGDTGDMAWSGAAVKGSMTRGIESPEHYYYRRVFTDAANAVMAARGLPGADARRVVTAGGSQGAALALAANALAELRGDGKGVQGTIANVPFLCNFPRAVGLTGQYPYQEIVDYLKTKREAIDTVFQTLSYFDGVNLVKRASAPALFSVALMDAVAPPSTGFAARNWYGGPTQMEVYPYNQHEGGGVYQVRREIEWLHELFG